MLQYSRPAQDHLLAPLFFRPGGRAADRLGCIRILHLYGHLLVEVVNGYQRKGREQNLEPTVVPPTGGGCWLRRRPATGGAGWLRTKHCTTTAWFALCNRIRTTFLSARPLLCPRRQPRSAQHFLLMRGTRQVRAGRRLAQPRTGGALGGRSWFAISYQVSYQQHLI